MADPHLIRGQTQPLDPRDKRLTIPHRERESRQFFTSFLFGTSMGDIRVNEDVLFVLDRVSGMEQNSEEYRVEPVKNEVKAVEVMQHCRKNLTSQYCSIMQL